MFKQMRLSHEFREPLTSMLMVLESLLTVLDNEFMREKVLMVIAQINLLLCQVTDMLDLILLD